MRVRVVEQDSELASTLKNPLKNPETPREPPPPHPGNLNFMSNQARRVQIWVSSSERSWVVNAAECSNGFFDWVEGGRLFQMG